MAIALPSWGLVKRRGMQRNYVSSLPSPNILSLPSPSLVMAKEKYERQTTTNKALYARQ